MWDVRFIILSRGLLSHISDLISHIQLYCVSHFSFGLLTLRAGPGLSTDDQEIGRPSKSNVQVASESGCGFALQKQLHSFHRIKIQHK